MDFSVTASGERDQMLFDAARRLDALAGHLGADDEPATSEFSDLLRGIAADKVDFGPYPDLYEVPTPEQLAGKGVTPPWGASFVPGNSYWWMYLPLLLFPRKDWAFNRLEVRIEFSPGESDPRLRPTAFDILPNRRFDTVMTAGARVDIGVGADGRFAVDTGAIPFVAAGLPVQAHAAVEAKASVGVGAAFKPMPYRAVSARINHTEAGLDRVFWRLDGAEFFEATPPQLVVIMQVPDGCAVPEIVCAMQAYRRFNLFPAGLQSAIRQLPEAVRVFFKQGAPIPATARYDLTTRLRPAPRADDSS